MALKRLLGCACIFSAGHLHKAYEERISAWNNNGSWEVITIDDLP